MRLTSKALPLAIALVACGHNDHAAITSPPPPAIPGSVVVRATTTGTDRDIASIAIIDSGLGNLVIADSSVRIDSISPGTHTLHLRGVASNCSLDQFADQSITVASGDTLTVSFKVTCTAVTRQIMFGSNRDGNADLYVMNADGSNVVRWTTNTAYTGSWSPDGSQLVYVHQTSGYYQIYVSKADGSAPQQLTTDIGDHELPSWSPDGRRIAYVEFEALWVMAADGSHRQKIQPPPSGATSASWSPDGNRLAFTTLDASPTSQIYTVRFDGSDLRQVTHFSATSPSIDNVAWSPDGSKIAFTSYPNAISNLFVMNIDGSQVTEITQGIVGYENDQAAWSPDGSQLAFHTTRDGGHPEIYMTSPDGTNQINLTQNPLDNNSPAWHP